MTGGQDDRRARMTGGQDDRRARMTGGVSVILRSGATKNLNRKDSI